jgi:hypothetical protein
MSTQNCTGAVDLFSHDQASESVGHGERPQRKQQLRAPAGIVAPAAGGADREHDLPSPLVAPFADPGSERFRRHLTTAAIQQNRRRRNPALLTIEPRKQILLAAKRLRLGRHKGRRSFEIELTQSVEFVAARSARANGCQKELHPSRIPVRHTPFPMRELPSCPIFGYSPPIIRFFIYSSERSPSRANVTC